MKPLTQRFTRSRERTARDILNDLKEIDEDPAHTHWLDGPLVIKTKDYYGIADRVYMSFDALIFTGE